MNSVLKETLEKLRTDRLDLQAKIKEMKAAEDAIRTLLEVEDDGAAKKGNTSRISVADKIQAVLSDYPKGLDINNLTDAVSLKFEEEAQKSSIQSQLSRMKDSTVENIDGRWRIAGPIIGAVRDRSRAPSQAHSTDITSSLMPGYDFTSDDEIPF